MGRRPPANARAMSVDKATVAKIASLREDVVDADPLTGGGKREAVLANAPAAEHGFFGVPKVIE